MIGTLYPFNYVIESLDGPVSKDKDPRFRRLYNDFIDWERVWFTPEETYDICVAAFCNGELHVQIARKFEHACFLDIKNICAKVDGPRFKQRHEEKQEAEERLKANKK